VPWWRARRNSDWRFGLHERSLSGDGPRITATQGRVARRLASNDGLNILCNPLGLGAFPHALLLSAGAAGHARISRFVTVRRRARERRRRAFTMCLDRVPYHSWTTNTMIAYAGGMARDEGDGHGRATGFVSQVFGHPRGLYLLRRTLPRTDGEPSRATYEGWARGGKQVQHIRQCGHRWYDAGREIRAVHGKLGCRDAHVEEAMAESV
jgi:hypothetical protein